MNGAAVEKIKQGQQIIKADMPEVYALINEAAQVYGKEVWALVRRGLAGEAGCFWATENGLVQGTPFTGQPAWQTVGLRSARPGSSCVCIMAPLGGKAGG